MGFRSDLIEKQLAHQERSKSRASYKRAIYLEERREMMQQWADYLDQLARGASVVPMKIEGLKTAPAGMKLSAEANTTRKKPVSKRRATATA